MGTFQLVQVGTATAQASIDMAARTPGDPDAGALRAGLLEFLRVHATEVSADPGTENLLDAYRAWLETAVNLYSTGDESQVREFMRRGALLGAEYDLLAAGGTAPVAAATGDRTA